MMRTAISPRLAISSLRNISMQRRLTGDAPNAARSPVAQAVAADDAAATGLLACRKHVTTIDCAVQAGNAHTFLLGSDRRRQPGVIKRIRRGVNARLGF